MEFFGDPDVAPAVGAEPLHQRNRAEFPTDGNESSGAPTIAE